MLLTHNKSLLCKPLLLLFFLSAISCSSNKINRETEIKDTFSTFLTAMAQFDSAKASSFLSKDVFFTNSVDQKNSLGITEYLKNSPLWGFIPQEKPFFKHITMLDHTTTIITVRHFGQRREKEEIPELITFSGTYVLNLENNQWVIAEASVEDFHSFASSDKVQPTIEINAISKNQKKKNIENEIKENKEKQRKKIYKLLSTFFTQKSLLPQRYTENFTFIDTTKKNTTQQPILIKNFFRNVLIETSPVISISNPSNNEAEATVKFLGSSLKDPSEEIEYNFYVFQFSLIKSDEWKFKTITLESKNLFLILDEMEQIKRTIHTLIDSLKKNMTSISNQLLSECSFSFEEKNTKKKDVALKKIKMDIDQLENKNGFLSPPIIEFTSSTKAQATFYFMHPLESTSDIKEYFTPTNYKIHLSKIDNRWILKKISTTSLQPITKKTFAKLFTRKFVDDKVQSKNYKLTCYSSQDTKIIDQGNPPISNALSILKFYFKRLSLLFSLELTNVYINSGFVDSNTFFITNQTLESFISNFSDVTFYFFTDNTFLVKQINKTIFIDTIQINKTFLYPPDPLKAIIQKMLEKKANVLVEKKLKGFIDSLPKDTSLIINSNEIIERNKIINFFKKYAQSQTVLIQDPKIDLINKKDGTRLGTIELLLLVNKSSKKPSYTTHLYQFIFPNRKDFYPKSLIIRATE